MGRFVGWLYCFLWLSSILAGYAALFCPLFPVLLISNKLYRYITDIFFTYWQYYPTALLEILCGCDIQVSGDPVRTGETSILIMNHRTRTDWNFLWPTLYHSVVGKNKLAHSTKFVLKDVIRHIPGPGWVMQLACFVYIKRCWSTDKEILQKYIHYVCDISYKHSLLVFPEGTDLTENTKKSSDSFADKHNLQRYDYVLHPRTTGFTFLAHQMMLKNHLDAVYDITLVYPDTVPQNEKVLLKGYFPKVVKVHFARYPKYVLPKSEGGLREFLEKRWLEKEMTIKEFYATGHFLHGKVLRTGTRWELYLALVFWSLLPYAILYIFITSYSYSGFQNLEIALHNLKRRK